MEILISQAQTTKSLDFSGFYSYLKTLSQDSWQYSVLKRFFYLAQVYEEVKPSQGRLAENIGVSRMTINTYVAFLKNLGVFKVKRRGLYQSARYIFAEEFQDDQVRGTLGTFFKAFCYMSFKKRQQLLFKSTLHSIELREIYEDKRELDGDCLACEVGESPLVRSEATGEDLCASCLAPVNVSFKTHERGRSPSVHDVLGNIHGSSLSSYAKATENKSSKENEMDEDNYNYREVKPTASSGKPIARTFLRSHDNKPIVRTKGHDQKGDIQTFVGPLESLSYAQLQAELDKEFNKELSFNSNPRNLVGPDYRRVLSLKKELARRDQQAKNDRGGSIMTAIDF